jgi:hypothetical protein
MAALDPIDSSLFEGKYLRFSQVQGYIVNEFWEPHKSVLSRAIPYVIITLLSLQLQNYDTYFKFYLSVLSSQVAGDHAVGTHRHLVDLVRLLKQETTSTKAQIRTKLLNASFLSLNFRAVSAERINSSLELAIRLWLMVSFSGHGSFVPGHTPVSFPSCTSEIVAMKLPLTLLDFLARP